MAHDLVSMVSTHHAKLNTLYVSHALSRATLNNIAQIVNLVDISGAFLNHGNPRAEGPKSPYIREFNQPTPLLGMCEANLSLSHHQQPIYH